ncbi:MAG: triose-phosphate isomerase [Nanoarchaeota archaeon]|nr:triose-phosphate isomerase [Nanoarchaeota archaeon]
MRLKTPLIIINLKTYKEGTGKNAVALAKLCEQISKKTKTNIVVAVQAADIYQVAHSVSIPVLAQHIDAIDYGSHTGWMLPAAAKEAGAVGTLISHSEHHLSLNEIKKTIAAARKAGLACVVCARTANEAQQIARLKPDFIAAEPPELIGGKISVSTAKPGLISGTVARVNSVAKIPVLTGAGIKNGKDVSSSIKLGAKGILVASGVVKAKDKRAALKDLVNGMK